MKYLLILILLLTQLTASSQSYTNYFTGNATNIQTTPQGGTCMMGGASEHDGAMQWFLERANGGDVLVLRASGSDGYNDYMYSELGVTINSVETIVFNNSSAANETYIHNKIQQAEAIWFAGGDQWNYVSYWRDTPIASLINEALQNRNIVIGGTSAGMAILGNYYFSAMNGTVTSNTAIISPYDSDVTVDSTDFLQIKYMEDVITDTHYDDPDRKGRHVVFLARILTDYGVAAKGIACNEYTAVCVDENGLARVFGDYPNYPETAFFLQTNCELPASEFGPESCNELLPMIWYRNGAAIRVYKVNGTNEGTHTFSLTDWETGNGGTWENWYVDDLSVFNETTGTQIDCSPVSSTIDNDYIEPKVFPNPFSERFSMESKDEIIAVSLVDVDGRKLLLENELQTYSMSINKSSLPTGVYFLKLETRGGLFYYKLLKR